MSSSLEKAKSASIELPDEFAGSMSAVNLEQMFRFARDTPRDFEAAIDKTVQFFSRKESRAAKAYYTIPREGKQISGPSIRLAEVLASNMGNLHISTITRPILPTDKMVTTVSMAIDLESRSVFVEEVSVGIVYNNGRRYTDSMILTATMACRSKSYRNAVFRMVGKLIAEEIQEEVREAVTAKIKQDKTVTAPDRMIKAGEEISRRTKGKYGAKDLVLLFGKSSIDEVTADDVAAVSGYWNAVSDGETTWDEVFHGPQQATDSSGIMEEMGLGTKNKLDDFLGVVAGED